MCVPIRLRKRVLTLLLSASQPLVLQLQAGAQVPLPSSPSPSRALGMPEIPGAAEGAVTLNVVTEAASEPVLLAAPAPVRTSLPGYNNPISSRHFVQVAAPAAAQRIPKLPALQAADQARKREEQLQQERRQKKVALEQQREAARRAAMLKPQAMTADGEAGEASAPGGAAGAAEAPMAPLPRLKQMIEVRLDSRVTSLLLLACAHNALTQAREKLAETHRRKIEQSSGGAAPENAEQAVRDSPHLVVHVLKGIPYLQDDGRQKRLEQLEQARQQQVRGPKQSASS